MIQAESQFRTVYLGRINPVPAIGVCYWLLMMFTGTDLLNATLLTAAIVFGLMSVGAAGGVKKVPGVLNFILILKFLLIGIVLKAVTLQPSDSIMRAPRTTAEVMAIGFFALYVGTVIYWYAPKFKGVVQEVTDRKMYLALAILFAVTGFGSCIAILISQVSYTTNLSGGLWGIAHQLQGNITFCIIPAMYYAWTSGSKRFLSHPLVVTILIGQLVVAIASTTKQAVMEPVVCYLSVGLIRYGIRSKAVWSIAAAGAFFYMSIVYPYSQYVRDHGGRDGSLKVRLEAIQDVFFSVSTDSNYREMVETKITGGDTYLGKDVFRPISRLAMVSEADVLVAATDATQSYTGWETITNGLKLMVPSFLIADKPTSGGGNLLGHITGDLAPDDMTTQVSYGFMANLYNAFGLYGVLFGTIIFISLFYYVLRIWFASAVLTTTPMGSTIWYLMLGMAYQHSLVEFPIGGLLPTLVTLPIYVAVILLARLLASLMAGKRAWSSY